MLGVSECLLGGEVRYDGKSAANDNVIHLLGATFGFLPFCPEAGIGGTTPRPPMDLVRRNGVIQAVVRDNGGEVITARLRKYSLQAVEDMAGVCGFVLKSRSPSCALTDAKVSGGAGLRRAAGLFASILAKKTYIPLVDERRLEKPGEMESFMERALLCGHWIKRGLRSSGRERLMEFHESVWLLAACRGRKGLAEWRSLSLALRRNLSPGNYFLRLMDALSAPSGRKARAFGLRRMAQVLAKSHGKSEGAAIAHVRRYSAGEETFEQALSGILDAAEGKGTTGQLYMDFHPGGLKDGAKLSRT